MFIPLLQLAKSDGCLIPRSRTWRGERGEQWSSAQGLESILLSIQSLMSANPFENEPGYENCRQARDRDLQAAYVKKVCVRSFTMTELTDLTTDATRSVTRL